jgi:hypothetical protein
MKYYNPTKNWKKLKPIMESSNAMSILNNDFNKFTMGRWNEHFPMNKFPRDFESCDWECDLGRGRRPEYFKYVKHSACHWIVNFNLFVISKAEPNRDWRIVTSPKHSTVWDGKYTIYDLNFLALGISCDEAFQLADEGEHLSIGELLEVGYATNANI